MKSKPTTLDAQTPAQRLGTNPDGSQKRHRWGVLYMLSNDMPLRGATKAEFERNRIRGHVEVEGVRCGVEQQMPCV